MYDMDIMVPSSPISSSNDDSDISDSDEYDHSSLGMNSIYILVVIVGFFRIF